MQKQKKSVLFFFVFNRKIIYYLFVCLDFNRTNSKFDEGLLRYSGSAKPFVIQTLFLCFGSLDHFFFLSRFFGVLSHFSSNIFLEFPLNWRRIISTLYSLLDRCVHRFRLLLFFFILFGNLTKRKYVIQLLDSQC